MPAHLSLFLSRSMPRGEMFDYIVAHRRLGEAEACKFFHQIVDGVEALHGFDITHRDLKPEVPVYLYLASLFSFLLQLCSHVIFNLLMATRSMSPCPALLKSFLHPLSTLVLSSFFFYNVYLSLFAALILHLINIYLLALLMRSDTW